MTKTKIRLINLAIALVTLALIWTCAQVPMNPTGRVDLVPVKVRF